MRGVSGQGSGAPVPGRAVAADAVEPVPVSPLRASIPSAEDVALREALVAYALHYGPRCRDCADENGVCPATGISCGDGRKAVEYIVGALIYGASHGFCPAALISRASDEVLADAGGAQQLPVPPPYWCEGMGKYGMSLSFEGGVLLINIAGYDDRDGHGQIAFKPDDAKKDDEGYLCVGLPNSELIAIRDQLNKWFPPEIESVLRPADGTELPHKDGWRILRSVDPDGPNPQLLWERVPLSANPVTVDASAMSARSDETQSGSVRQDASAVPTADAQIISPNPKD